MKIQVRKAAVKDIDILVKLWKEFMRIHDDYVIARNPILTDHLKYDPKAERYFKEWIGKNLKSKDSLILVAEVDTKPVGYIFTEIKPNIRIFRIKRFGRINDLFIQQKYQRLGISSRFHEETLKWLKSKKIDYLTLFVFNDNDIPRKIYEHWGFFNYGIEMRKKI